MGCTGYDDARATIQSDSGSAKKSTKRNIRLFVEPENSDE